VDAAVTAAAVLGVVEPHMTGIGGDVFALVWPAGADRPVGLNASGRSGSLMTREALLARGRTAVPSEGAESVTVPGALSGWAALLDRYGGLSLADALQPAIGHAEAGFPVTPVVAREWAAEAERLRADEGARATFLVEGKRAPRAGEWYRNPELAETLRLVAERGSGLLYGGELGRRLVARVRELGGYLTLADLSKHQPLWVEPIAADFRGRRVWEPPPNGQGVAALEILRILEPYDLAGMGHNSPEYLHHLIEATKLAFADLARWVGDPDAMAVASEDLLREPHIASRRALLDPFHAARAVEPGAPTAGDTVYLSVADRYGNMVSFVNSLYGGFGSGLVVPGTGFALQNRGAGFTLEPGRANTVGPRRRPLHTIIPAFVTRRAPAGGAAPWLAFGVMGGSMQPQGQVQVLLNLTVFGFDLQEAIDAPRFRWLDGARVALEPEIGGEVRDRLRALGHEIVPDGAVGFGGGQATLRVTQGWAAASDRRKDGLAIGH
jgi:gamma-glutamyltranspeptidase/glutathione hydrolase